jgi:PTH1 family peptidyl-tRNA hydrolase
MVVDLLAGKFGSTFRKSRNYLIAEIDRELILVKPLLFMNNSGLVVKQIIESQPLSDMFIVVHDDVAFPLGRIKIRKNGGAGGHNGVLSIIYYLKTKNFPRIRIGIDKPPLGVSLTDYVLGEFSPDEFILLDRVLNYTCNALIDIQKRGLDYAMSYYNSLNLNFDN